MPNELTCGDPIPLRSTHGPISFGGVVQQQVVSWSAPDALDLLVSQVWRGIYLYPSLSLSPEELSRDPIKVCEPLAIAGQAFAVDWNHDGEDELIITGQESMMYLIDRKAGLPRPSFVKVGPLRGKDGGLAVSIPYENPHNQMDELGGYIDGRFCNGTCPAVFPVSSPDAIDLIVGDWAGNLWWLPDQSGGKGTPYYDGLVYKKSDPTRLDKDGLIERYGSRYLKPRRKITDTEGRPFLLGTGRERGKDFPGGQTKLSVFSDPGTGSRDLLVLAGHVTGSTHYLKYQGEDVEGVPVFRDLGAIEIQGLDLSDCGWGFHHSFSVVDWNRDGAADLVVSTFRTIGLLERVESRSEVPAFRFKGWIESADAPTYGDCFTETLTDRQTGAHLLVDGHYMEPVSVRQILPAADGIRLSGTEAPILDQDGPFLKGDCQTDPNVDFAAHCLAKWDFDGSGRQHLIVGNDGGLLYLLIEEEDLGAGGTYRMRSVGPLRDTDANVIKTHNRVCPAAIDLDGDGREDLVLAGASYQMGIALDPNPGGGIYYVLHEGLGDDGLPRLSPPKQMTADGEPLRFKTNTSVKVQALDIDGDGCRDIIASCWDRLSPSVEHEDADANGRTTDGAVYKLAGDPIALHDTGLRVPHFRKSCLVDVDGDGKPELVESGGEQGLGFYRKVEVT